MQFYPAAMFKLLLPTVAIGLAFWLRTSMDQLGSELRVIVSNLPYLLCLAAMLLAYQFNRGRLLLASLGVGFFYWMIQSQLQVSLSQPEAGKVYLAASLALPLLCLYLLLLPEIGVRSQYGMIAALGFLFLALSCVLLAAWLPEASEASASYYAPRPAAGYVLSRGATLLVALVALAGLFLLAVRNDDTDGALLGVFAALYLALAQLHLAHISVVMSVAAGACLVWGSLRSSHAMAYRDELTGLLGRRALNEHLSKLGRNYCIAMLDVDHFKKFNDTHGHDVGDEVLKMVASRISQVGSGGTAYRYGGEEFCVVFPRKALEDCAEALDLVRENVAGYIMSIRDRELRPARASEGVRKRGATRLGSSQVAVTISAGLAARSEDNPTADEVMMAADSNLYRAKKAGRNRVVY